MQNEWNPSCYDLLKGVVLTPQWFPNMFFGLLRLKAFPTFWDKLTGTRQVAARHPARALCALGVACVASGMLRNSRKGPIPKFAKTHATAKTFKKKHMSEREFSSEVLVPLSRQRPETKKTFLASTNSARLYMNWPAANGCEALRGLRKETIYKRLLKAILKIWFTLPKSVLKSSVPAFKQNAKSWSSFEREKLHLQKMLIKHHLYRRHTWGQWWKQNQSSKPYIYKPNVGNTNQNEPEIGSITPYFTQSTLQGYPNTPTIATQQRHQGFSRPSALGIASVCELWRVELIVSRKKLSWEVWTTFFGNEEEKQGL